MGAYASGLATCGDNPLGCLLLSLSNEFYADVALPRMLTIWTGFSQSNPGYSQGRMYNIGLQIAVMTKNGVTEAPDYLAGTKLAGYGSLWGFGSVIPGPVYSFYTPNAEQGLYEAKAQLMTAPMVSLFADPAGTSAKYYKDWLTNRFPSYNETFLRDNNGEYVWWHFLYNDPAVPAVPAPTTVHFSSTDRARCVAIYGSALCPADEGKYYSTSNQNWNADRTYVAFNATSFSCLDHCSDDAGGWLLVAKNGKVLISGDSNNFMSSRAGRGYVELGGTPGNLRIAEKGPVNLYWTAGDDSYMVSNANLTSTFKAEANAVSVSRQLIHLKSGAQDYVIDHARAVTSVSTAIRGLQHFHLNECGTPSSTSCITMNGAAATVANSQPGAKVISKALGIGGNVIIKTQGGSETDGSYPGGEGKTFRWAVCPSSNGSACTNATAAEWVVVHMPSTDSNAALPPVVQAGTGPFRIVEIQDPAFPKVAVFTAAGQTANALNFTTSHTGSAQYVVSGLEAGAYTIARNGSPAGSRVAAVGGNSISFESESGSISIDQGPPPLTIVTESLPTAVLGKPYNSTVSAFSSTTPYTWQQVSGTLCTGLTFAQSGNNAIISGSASVLGTCTFTVRVDNSTNTENDSKVYSITVIEPGPPVDIATTWLPAGRLGDPYTGKLRAAGGTLPVTWSITAGSLCPGLVLDTHTGEILGVPSTLGVCVFTARVTDLGFDFVGRQFFVAVVENTQVPLAISAARASESAAVVQFGRRGLDFADACSLVLRLGGLSGSVLSTISSPSGPSRRTLIAGGLPSGQNIHATVTCGPDSATAQFTTGFTPPGPRVAKLIFSPPAGSPPVADLVVFYGDSPSMVNSLVASCSGGSCVALISVDAPFIYWRGVYRDPLANPVATTATHHIAPR